jgi:pyruvate formate lyase activating enzyme
MRKEAMHYRRNDTEDIICSLCPHNCRINEGGRGVCGVREVKGGVFETMNYGNISSIGLDPIEKKPLYHYKPGSLILSAGSFGCNFHCDFCQNYSISKELPKTRETMPEELIEIALENRAAGNIGVAFTYNEPSIWYEYVYDTSRKCRENGLDVVLVSNGYINSEPLKELLPYVDAMNIDLKAFNNEFYRKICGGDIEYVMDTISRADSLCHVEVATLIIEGYNDGEDEIERLAEWLASINKDMPLHLSKYHPAYKFTAPPTSTAVMKRVAKVAGKYLHHVYIGNVSQVDNNTYCYNCGEELVGRNGYNTSVFMKSDKCHKCGAKINITL